VPGKRIADAILLRALSPATGVRHRVSPIHAAAITDRSTPRDPVRSMINGILGMPTLSPASRILHKTGHGAWHTRVYESGADRRTRARQSAGDIYSFAVMLFEIFHRTASIHRREPFHGLPQAFEQDTSSSFGFERRDPFRARHAHSQSIEKSLGTGSRAWSRFSPS